MSMETKHGPGQPPPGGSHEAYEHSDADPRGLLHWGGWLIAVLIAVLLPALSNARRSANDVKCASNVRQLCMSLINYSADYKGKFPPNVNAGGYSSSPTNPATAQEWYHVDRIGKSGNRTLPVTHVSNRRREEPYGRSGSS